MVGRGIYQRTTTRRGKPRLRSLQQLPDYPIESSVNNVIIWNFTPHTHSLLSVQGSRKPVKPNSTKYRYLWEEAARYTPSHYLTTRRKKFQPKFLKTPLFANKSCKGACGNHRIGEHVINVLFTKAAHPIVFTCQIPNFFMQNRGTTERAKMPEKVPYPWHRTWGLLSVMYRLEK